MQTNLFFNTTHLQANDLERNQDRALSQTELILKLFTEYPTSDFTPFDVCFRLGNKILITSIRRSLSVLTDLGDLERLGKDRRRKGLHGELNYCWRLARKVNTENQKNLN